MQARLKQATQVGVSNIGALLTSACARALSRNSGAPIAHRSIPKALTTQSARMQDASNAGATDEAKIAATLCVSPLSPT